MRAPTADRVTGHARGSACNSGRVSDTEIKFPISQIRQMRSTHPFIVDGAYKITLVKS